MKKTIIESVSTKELMDEICRRNDIVIIGNWYYKEHIKDIASENDISISDEQLDEFIDINSPYLNNESIFEQAKDDLVCLMQDFLEDVI